MRLPPTPGASRGQGTVEYVALVLVVGALLLVVARTAAPVDAVRWLAAAIGDVIAGGDRGRPRSRPDTVDDLAANEQAFVLRAVEGAQDGSAPALHDALALLTDRLGAAAGAAQLERLALRRLAVSAPGRFRAGRYSVFVDRRATRPYRDLFGGTTDAPEGAPLWSDEEPRPTDRSAVHVVSGSESARLLAALHRHDTQNVREQAIVDLVVAEALQNSAWTSALAAVLTLGGAFDHPQTPQELPAGLRRDDEVVCLPIRRRDGVDAEHRDRLRHMRPDLFRGDGIDTWHDRTRIIVLRAGRIISEAIGVHPACS